MRYLRYNPYGSATIKTPSITEPFFRCLHNLTDLYLAEMRWRKLQRGRSKTIPLEEIADHYGLVTPLTEPTDNPDRDRP